MRGAPPFSSNARADELVALLTASVGPLDRHRISLAIQRAYDAGVAKGRRVRVAVKP